MLTDAPHPHEYSRSSTKRIYESVFRIVMNFFIEDWFRGKGGLVLWSLINQLLQTYESNQWWQFNLSSLPENENGGKLLLLFRAISTIIPFSKSIANNWIIHQMLHKRCHLIIIAFINCNIQTSVKFSHGLVMSIR